jgi:hypothetical protein
MSTARFNPLNFCLSRKNCTFGGKKITEEKCNELFKLVTFTSIAGENKIKGLPKRAGNYVINTSNYDDFLRFVANLDVESAEYCFSETPLYRHLPEWTEKDEDGKMYSNWNANAYRKMFFDLDMKEDLADSLGVEGVNKVWAQIIEHMENVIYKWVVEPNIERSNSDKLDKYIVCSRKDKAHKLHIIFPGLIVNANYALALTNILRESILNDEDIPESVRESVEKPNGIIDDQPQLYGGSLRILYTCKPGCEVIKNGKLVSGYYDVDRKRSNYDGLPTSDTVEGRIELLKLTSITTNASECNWDPEVCYEEEDDIVFVKDQAVEYRPIDQYIKLRVKNSVKSNSSSGAKFDDTNGYTIECKDEEFTLALLNNLNPERYRHYSTQFPIVRFLRNIGRRDLAHELFKKYDPKYSQEEVNGMYNPHQSEKVIRIGSVIIWSKQDNPEKHKEIMAKWRAKQRKPVPIPVEPKTGVDALFDEVYEEDYTRPLQLVFGEFDSEIHESECDADEPQAFMVKAGTGTGKTSRAMEAIIQLIDRGYKRMLMIIPRVALTYGSFGAYD